MKQESAANAWFALFRLFVIPNVCNCIPLWNSYLVRAKRQIGDRAQGFLNFSDSIQDVATSCDCWYQQAQDSNRIPNNSFISSLHTQTAIACVIHNAASSVPLYMNKLVRAVRLLTYFRGVFNLNLYPSPTIQTGSFRGLLTLFMRNSETVPGSRSAAAKRFTGSTMSSSRKGSIGSCVKWKPAATPMRTRPEVL